MTAALEILDWSTLDAAGRLEALARPRRRTEARVIDTVREIMDDVRTRGGAARVSPAMGWGSGSGRPVAPWVRPVAWW